MFEINKIMLRPHFDMCSGIFGLSGKKNRSLHETVVMHCQFCDRISVAPSNGNFRRRPQVTGTAGGGVAAW